MNKIPEKLWSFLKNEDILGNIAPEEIQSMIYQMISCVANGV